MTSRRLRARQGLGIPSGAQLFITPLFASKTRIRRAVQSASDQHHLPALAHSELKNDHGG